MSPLSSLLSLFRLKKTEQKNPYECITLKGEKVKSYGEKEIADFLFDNDIPYRYEEPYIYNPNYHPDFHILDTNIWIEYFGIDRNGKVPEWFEGKNPSKKYKKQIKWKKKIHRRNRTKLICLYAYQRSEGTLIDTLSHELRKQGIRTIR